MRVGVCAPGNNQAGAVGMFRRDGCSWSCARGRSEEPHRGKPEGIDENRTSYDEDRGSWRFWLLLGTATKPDKAFIYVRKSDCSTDWEPFVYSM